MRKIIGIFLDRGKPQIYELTPDKNNKLYRETEDDAGVKRGKKTVVINGEDRVYWQATSNIEVLKSLLVRATREWEEKTQREELQAAAMEAELKSLAIS